MDIFKEIAPLKKYLRDRKKKDEFIGLVPTMGALHEGHLTLINASKCDNDITVSTIFVNPTQFNNQSDLEKYPRTLEGDLQLLEEAGCNCLFVPDEKEVYLSKPTLTLDFGVMATQMEGEFRPGHFSGVGLIVGKLFNIIQPDRAYFGQKDLQQFFIIRQLVQDLSYDIELKCEPTVREASGLAMSSRNMRLSTEGKQAAAALYKGLERAALDLRAGQRPNQIKQRVSNALEEQRIKLEYFEIVDSNTMKVVENHLFSGDVALCIAAFVEGVRLIDNIIINLKN